MTKKIFVIISSTILSISCITPKEKRALRSDLYDAQSRILQLEQALSMTKEESNKNGSKTNQRIANTRANLDKITRDIRRLEGNIDSIRIGVMTGELPGISPEQKEQKQLCKSLTIEKLEDQVKDLKTEIGELYLETRMLKKILAYSQRKKRENSSIITSENLDQFQKDAK